MNTRHGRGAAIRAFSMCVALVFYSDSTLLAQTTNTYVQGSSHGRMWKMSNDRTSVSDSGPSTFPLTNEWNIFTRYAGAPVVAGNRLFVDRTSFSGEQLLSCYDVRTGAHLWDFNLELQGGGNFNFQSITVADNTVVVPTKNTGLDPPGALYAINAHDGSLKWKFDNQAGSFACTPPVIDNGVVYFSGISDKLRAVYLDTGLIKWESSDVVGATAFSGVTLADGKIVMIAHRALRAFDAATGANIWSNNINTPTYAECTPAVYDGRVYLTKNHTTNGLIVYDASTGNRLWDYGYFRTGKYASPTVADGQVFILTATSDVADVGVLMAFDATAPGPSQWTFQFDRESFLGSPVVASGVVYFAADKFYALDAATGSEIWSTNSGLQYAEDPFIRHGWAFFEADDRLYAYSDGTPWPPLDNDAPVIALPGPHTLPVGSQTNFTITASDPDSEPFSFTNTVRPAGSTFISNVFSWTAGPPEEGTTVTLCFIADDYHGAANSVVTSCTSIIIPFDFDGDHMGDGWEWIEFGTLTNSGSTDNDGDVVGNFDEYIAGTDPQDANSKFSTTVQKGLLGITAWINITTEPGKLYTIEYTDGLPDTNAVWSTFANMANGVGTWVEASPTSTVFTFSDSESIQNSGGPTASGIRHYRINVRNP